MYKYDEDEELEKKLKRENPEEEMDEFEDAPNGMSGEGSPAEQTDPTAEIDQDSDSVLMEEQAHGDYEAEGMEESLDPEERNGDDNKMEWLKAKKLLASLRAKMEL